MTRARFRFFKCFEPARDWTFEHLKANPEHVSYEQVVRRPWGMVRGEPV
ncbi:MULTISPECIES: DUF7848 domain-containing protein [Streptomycetaceae]|nr:MULTISPECIES: hypothetical protein [Streptomycetaceae]MYS62027.1 hypothetical protein [Streptomyces sp. SID5468]